MDKRGWRSGQETGEGPAHGSDARAIALAAIIVLTIGFAVVLAAQLLGSSYACVSSADCIFVTGSHFQQRVHGVYVLNPTPQ